MKREEIKGQFNDIRKWYAEAVARTAEWKRTKADMEAMDRIDELERLALRATDPEPREKILTFERGPGFMRYVYFDDEQNGDRYFHGTIDFDHSMETWVFKPGKEPLDQDDLQEILSAMLAAAQDSSDAD